MVLSPSCLGFFSLVKDGGESGAFFFFIAFVEMDVFPDQAITKTGRYADLIHRKLFEMKEDDL